MSTVTPSPPSNEPDTGRMAVLIGVLATGAVFYFGLFTPSFQVDSWSYYELSATVFNDFFRYNTVRQYVDPGPYSNSFPPLWPVLIAGTRALGLDFGIYTGYFLNSLIHLGLLAVLVRLARQLGAPVWVGVLTHLLLLSFQPYVVEDALAGGAMPLCLFLLLAAISILLQPANLPRAVAAGLLIGGACVTRFDYALAAAVLGIVLARASIAHAAIFAASVAFVLAPWVGYNLEHFGKPFASDNTRQVLATHPNSVLDYYSESPPTLTSDPIRWASGFLSKKLSRFVRGIAIALAASALPVIAIVWLAISPGVPGPVASTEYRRFVVLAGALAPATMLSLLLVGYGMMPRYYTLALILTLLVVLPAIGRRLPQPHWTRRRCASLLCLVALGAIIRVMPDAVVNRVDLISPREYLVSSAPTAEMRRIAELVQHDAAGKPYRIVVTDDVLAARFGAVTREPIALKPILRGSFADCVRDWHLTHVYDPVGWLDTIPHEGISFEPLPYPHLYRVNIHDQTRRHNP